MVGVAGFAPATSSLRTRPSAADITPCFKCRVESAEWRMDILDCRFRTALHFEFRTLRSTLEVAARVGLAPTPLGLTGRRPTLTPPGNCYLLAVVCAQ